MPGTVTPTTRTPEHIAFSRSLETFLIFVVSMFIVAALPALGQLQDDLTSCAAQPNTCTIHWGVWIIAGYRFFSAAVAALIAALGKYTLALKSASSNVTVTGTTAPVGTQEAAITVANGGSRLVIAPLPSLKEKSV